MSDEYWSETSEPNLPPLLMALAQRDINAARELLRNGADANVTCEDAGGKTPLFSAVESGNVAVARLLLEYGADINHKANKANLEYAPLMTAVAWNRTDMVRLLLEHGADVNATDSRGLNVLMQLHLPYNDEDDEALQSWRDILQMLFNAGADVNHRSHNGATPLMSAGRGLDAHTLNEREAQDMPEWEYISRLLAMGADVNLCDDKGWTPLMYAVYHGYSAFVRLLVEVGANINAVQDDGDTAWNIARHWGHTAIADYLMQRGAVEPENTASNLHQAIRWNKAEAVCAFLDAGADVEEVNSEYKTPLMAAIGLQADRDIITMLLSRGANADAFVVVAEDYGNTPLICAIDRGDAGIVRMLLEHGADVNAQWYVDSTPLVAAAWGGNAEIVRLLLEAGADVHATEERDDHTALHYAAKNHYNTGLVMAQMLIARGADVNARTNNDSGEYYGSNSVLKEAVRAGATEIVSLLLEHGADVNAVDAYGTTILLWAMDDEPKPEIVASLIRAGADVNMPGPLWQFSGSPLYIARRRELHEIVALLEAAGAEEGSSDTDASETHWFCMVIPDSSDP